MLVLTAGAMGMDGMTDEAMASVRGGSSYVRTDAYCVDFISLPQGSCCKRLGAVSTLRRCAGGVKLLLASARCAPRVGEACVLEEIVCPVYIEYDCIPEGEDLLCLAHEDCGLINSRESAAKAPLLICR